MRDSQRYATYTEMASAVVWGSHVCVGVCAIEILRKRWTRARVCVCLCRYAYTVCLFYNVHKCCQLSSPKHIHGPI